MEAQKVFPIIFSTLAFIGVIIAVAVWFGAAMSRKQIDSDRLEYLIAEGKKKFAGATGDSLLEFIRRDLYRQLRLAANNNKNIDQLSEDYVLIVGEQERIQSEEKMLGGEFMVAPFRRDNLAGGGQ